MDFLKELKQLDDKELEEKVLEKIRQLTEESREDYPDIDTLGYIINCNPEEYYIDKKGTIENLEVTLRCFFGGYIPKGMRIIYGLTYNMNGIASNNGAYYYLDDESYVIDFCKFIKNQDIHNEYELFDAVLYFLRRYFRVIADVDREQMHHLIYKNKTGFVAYEPTLNRGISDFYNKGNAQCSEYSIAAQNILSLFGMDMCLIIGRETTKAQNGEENSQGHSFNFVSFEEAETGDRVNYLIDFSMPVDNMDINFKSISNSPFLAELDEFTEDFLREFLVEEKHLVWNDYAYFIFGNAVSQLSFSKTRDYYVDSSLTPEKSVNKIKK